jgi:hypothetical protein
MARMNAVSGCHCGLKSGASMNRSLMPNRIAAAMLAAAACAPGAAAAAAEELPCRAERALYTLNSDPAFTAGFIPAKHFASMASNLYFWIKSPQRTYWFTFSVGNGYSGISLLPVGDPYIAADGDPDNGPVQLKAGELNLPYMRIYPMRHDLTLSETAPTGGDPAPDALFAPEIGTVMWYEPRAITEDASATRDAMTRGAFIRTGCLEKTPAPGYP